VVYDSIYQQTVGTVACMFSVLNVQAGLILCQGYILEKCFANQNRENQTQNSHLKQCISGGYGIDSLILYGV